MKREVPAWWPPKVGDKLRHETLHGTSGADRSRMGVKHVDALLRVLAVFEDMDGAERIVTAEWFPTRRRWNYEVFTSTAAMVGTIWPDGAAKPKDR